MARTDIFEKYEILEAQFRVWAVKMPESAKALRAEMLKRGKLAGWKHPAAFTKADKPKVMVIADPASDAARVADLIDMQKRAQAAVPDPYAGLTGFDRQLAIAKAKGITATVRLPSRAFHAVDCGLGTSSAAWAASEGFVA